jgi:hypothetical protein
VKLCACAVAAARVASRRVGARAVRFMENSFRDRCACSLGGAA